jgi:hypothetical protein
MSRRTTRVGRRPALMEPGVEEAFLAAVADGTPLTHAAIAAGVDPASFHRWMRAAEEIEERVAEGQRTGEPVDLDRVEERYRQFRQKLLRVRARVSAENVRRVAKVAEGGYLVKETPLVSREGTLVRDDDGEIVYVREYAPPDWKAAKFLLEASFPREFKRLEQADPLSGEGAGGAVESEDVASSLAAKVKMLQIERSRDAAEDEDITDAEIVEDDEREDARA